VAAKKKWNERSRLGRRLIAVTGAVEVAFLVATLIDIKRRPADEIKGSKRTWTALAFVNIVGPIASFTVGRRRRGATVWPPPLLAIPRRSAP